MCSSDLSRAGKKTHFDASTSTGGPIVRYDWKFGDGKKAQNAGPKVAHKYKAAGTFTVKLTESNSCAEKAVFGPLGVAFNGTGAFCNGKRQAVKTRTVRIRAAG